MIIQPDFEELLQLFAKHQVEYMIVGGYAVAFHGHPRFTKDLDIFYRASPDNVTRLRNALVEFGFQQADVPENAFLTAGNIVVFGVDPVRVDLLNQIDGVDYDAAHVSIVVGRYGEAQANFIGREALILNKNSTPRAKDKADVEELS